MPNVIDAIREKMAKIIKSIETPLQADVVGIFGPIVSGVEYRVRSAIETLPSRRKKVAVVLFTGGGSIEATERIVNVLRHFYSEVVFIIPDVALSAGTILAMSGDSIMMDAFSCLGPIDPQVEREGKLVPALSYLEQFNRIVTRSAQGILTTAELALFAKLDLAELHSFEQARELTIDLLVNWLANYKFKDWSLTETRKLQVTQQMREDRARQIAEELNNHQRWRSHGRGISMRTLRDELKLKIDDFGANRPVAKAVRDYFDFMLACMSKEGLSSLVTSRTYV